MRISLVLSTVLALFCGMATANAEKRVALVIGNNDYVNLPKVQQLEKAVNDARSVGDALEKIGFNVIRGDNLGRQAMVDKFDELSRQLSPGDIAFFFFAGHGITLGGGNYILPADVPDVQTEQEVRLAHASLGETDVVSDLQSRGVRLAIVVLDACRNNPFARPGVRAVGGSRGFARGEPVRGVFTLYSAGLGQAALDRLNGEDSNPNSVFTRVFVPLLLQPGKDLGGLAVEVREEVAKLASAVGVDQRPAYYDETIGGRFYLAGLQLGDQVGPTVSPVDQQSNGPAAAERIWTSIQNSKNPQILETFIEQFGSTVFAKFARAQLRTLRASAAPVEKKANASGTNVDQVTVIPEAERFWANIQNSQNAAELELFIAKYHDSPLADLARIRLKGLRTKSASVDPAAGKIEPVAPPSRNTPRRGAAGSAGGAEGYTTCGPKGCQRVPPGCRAIPHSGGHGLGGRIDCRIVSPPHG
jgi:hypothetical protein